MSSDNKGRPPSRSGGSYQGSGQGQRSPGSSSSGTPRSSGYQGSSSGSGAPRPSGGYQGSNPNSGYRPGGGAPRPAGTSSPRPQGGSGGGYTPRPQGAGGYVPPAGGGTSGGGYAGARPSFPRPASSVPREPRDMPNKEKDTTRINQDIKAAEVRLVGADGEMVGVVPVRQALVLAEEAGLDLVEVSPNAVPPVCKILDYGKYKYAEQKKKAEARKKQKVVELKEIKLRPAIDDHDLSIKLAAAKRFLGEGDKVKFTMRFRGREMSNVRIGDELLDRVKNELENVGKMEQRSGIEGRQMVMILSPVK